ncbi:hypothetical protein HHK36_029295 [Tetracentron sinense]|uniref:WAT1-related protein n=1 Tax=Tetracentron sinense TaxID=13715 RepID=A0A834YHD5_TETSI|nr:hypothetical protein HHK36_029295 [Tetracentron sinense]
MDWKQCILGSRPALSMILVQFFLTGMQLLSRIILKQGMFIFTLMTYRHVVAAVCVAPFAFFMERGMGKKVTWLALLWLFFNSLFGYEIFGRMK